jgi:glycosyltransferase involved in cell wall biosynthesis
VNRKVCHLTSVHSPFDGRIFHRQCRALAATGYAVTLLAPADFERQERDGVTVLGVPRPSHRLGRPLVWWRLFRQALRLRPDVVHFHDPELLLLVPLLRLMLGRRCKIVYDVHEYFVDSIAVKHWIPRRWRPAVAWLARGLEQRLVRGVDGLVLAVEGQRPLYPHFRGPTAVVRNFPVATLFEGARPHPALDMPGFRLIYVGLILPQRGIDVLLEAMRRLHKEGLRDVLLFLIGPKTSPAYLERIQAFIGQHGLEEQVRWLGPVPPDQVPHYLAGADAGLAPGLYTAQYRRPSLFTKLFEYLLAGLPVVCADYPWSRPYVEEGRCGLVVPAEDAAAYAQAIRWLHDHPEEAREMGRRGRELVRRKYTWEREQEHLLAFYREILREHGARVVGGG